KAYPHLRELLPLVEHQLKERRLLFSEVWHLFKGYIGTKVPDWESTPAAQREQIILATGTTFISEQLPEPLQWLAGPIAQSTVLRGLRLKSVNQLLALIQCPAPAPACEDLALCNTLIQYLRDLEQNTEFIQRLNTWDTRLNRETGHWGIS